MNADREAPAGALMTRRSGWLIIIFSALIFCFSHLHQGTLAADAVRHASIAKHINASGEWIELYDPHEQRRYVNKPPLLLWMLAMQFRAFGYSTFVAKAPAVLFAFCSLLLMYRLMLRFDGQRTAVLAVLLLLANRAFTRDLLDLTFDGMVLCGAMLWLSASLTLAAEEETPRDPRFWLGAHLGLFLLTQSKIPYLLLVLFPTGMMLLRSGRVGAVLKNRGFWLGALPYLLFLSAWYAASGVGYLLGAADNQFVEPFRDSHGWWRSLSIWLGIVLHSYAPASWLGFWSIKELIQRVRARGQATNVELLLLLWSFPVVPIILLVGPRPRYLLVPMLAVVVLAALKLSALLHRVSARRLHLAAAGASVTLLLLVVGFDVSLHRADPIITLLRQEPRLLQEPVTVCVDSKQSARAQSAASRTRLLIDLEFDRLLPAGTSADLTLTPGEKILANYRCTRALSERGVDFATQPRMERAEVLEVQDARS